MKKLYLKLSAIIIVVVFCFVSISFGSFSEAKASSEMYANKNVEYLEKQAESILAYNQLLESFDSSTPYSDRICSTTHIYPENFGGAYINKKTGGLVVLFTDLMAIADVSRSLSTTADVTYEKCAYPINYIIDTIDEITASIEMLAEKNIIIDSVRDDIENNKVIVSVQNLEEWKKVEIRKIVDSPIVIFENSEGITTHARIGAGYTAISTDNNSYSTIGFAATVYMYYPGLGPGFVIAGHEGDFVGEVFNYNGQILGTVTHTAWYDGSSADAAFVEAADGMIPTNVTAFNSLIVGVEAGSLPQNTLVYKYGISSHLTSGYVTSIYKTVTYTVNDQIYRIAGQMVADYYAEAGDSGGPVVIYSGSSLGDRPEYTLVGIHSGGIGSTYSYFSPYSNIVNELGIDCIVNGS